MALTRLQAIEKVITFSNASEYPELTNDEIGKIVDEHKRTSTWTASTAYVVNQEIEPTVRNGRKYTCVVAGTSSATEPDFPDFGFTNQLISDGNVLMFMDTGAAYDEIYDVRASIRAAFLLKASKIAHLIDVKDGESTLSMSQLKKSLFEMAERYRPLEII